MESDKKSGKKNKKKEKKPEEPPLIDGATPVSMFSLFRFSSTLDKVAILTGILASLVSGLCFPAMIILFGRLTDTMVSNGITPLLDAFANSTIPCTQDICGLFLSGNVTLVENCLDLSFTDGEFIFYKKACDTDFFGNLELFGYGTAILGAVQLLLGYVAVFTLNNAAENQVYKIRSLFLQGILRQDIGWFDTHQSGDFASRITEDLNKLQEGIGEKVGMFVYFMTVFVASLISAFVYGWELSLVILSVMPVLMIASGVMAKVQSSIAELELQAYGTAGAAAEEVISSIRTVVAFGGQQKEVQRYEERLVTARQLGIKRSLWTGLGGGLAWFMIFVSYALAFWYGPKLILEQRHLENPTYDPSVFMIVFFNVLMGAMNIGQAAPYVEAFAVARAAGGTLFSVIDRQPSIDSSSEAGKKPKLITGRVQFKDVKFHYPSRPDVPILQGLSLDIEPGQTVALVGSSGCGKSTCIQLIQRFYDTLEGQVLIDGEPVTDLNVGWLREHIGVVSQEPVLFATNIEENIRMGNEKATSIQIQAAAKQANAHDFVTKLPNNYKTLVGDRGAQLSGGQKQRIAIARALIKDPKILLLDEATSALDTQSESIVQHALDKAREGRTTIIVAHRLTTIRSADKIIVLDNGVVAEVGSHEDLMAKNGLYFQLVTAQTVDEEADYSEKFDPAKNDEKTAPQSKRLRLQSEHIDDVVVVPTEEKSGNKKEDLPKPSLVRIMKLNAKEWPLIVIGTLASAANGISMPAYAILFGEVLSTLGIPDDDEAKRESMKYVYLFIGLAFVAGLAMFLQVFMFGIAGEKLTMRIRKLVFGTMLRQEMGWFDMEENSTGALCARLASDASSIQGATGSRVGTVTQSLASVGSGIGLSLYYSWKLGLVVIAFVPFVVISTYYQSKIVFGQNILEKEQLEKSSKAAVEAIGNIRTVAGLRREQYFHKVYMAALLQPHQAATKKAHLRGAIFGLAQSVPFFAYAATMFYGGKLIEDDGLDYASVFKVSEALIACTVVVGQALAFAPNFDGAMVSSARVFKLLDRKTLIDPSDNSGKNLQGVEKGVAFKDVEFTYTSRPDAQILKKLCLDIQAGKTIALVGSSGCGKSTTIQLLERFYDPSSGSVNVEDNNITDLNISSLRSKLGLVSQEPILFDRSIAENIAYGDNYRTVPMEEIIEAAKSANIHNFITSLPKASGYETRVGDKGTQLSGGQKQRVAIARALLRNPAILLLDEATSALDSESEKVVQDALDSAQKGRTCITIAHRLSTIQNADIIYVFHQGKVSESGKHVDLLQLKGLYHNLWIQSGSARH